MKPYLKRGLIILAPLLVIGGSILSWKGPSIIKHKAKVYLERNLAPLGIGEVRIDAVSLGWGRIYLRDIHVEASPEMPVLSVQEANITFSPFLKIKTIEVVGATLEFKEGSPFDIAKMNLQNIRTPFEKALHFFQHLKLPNIFMQDCLLMIPTSHSILKLPIHGVAEKTTHKNGYVLTIDWGDYDSPAFSGQLIFEVGSQGINFDIHSAHVDIDIPMEKGRAPFQIKVPEISLWGSTTDGQSGRCKISGFAKVERLGLPQYGVLKMPLDISLEAAGTLENITLDELTVVRREGQGDLLKAKGVLKPYEPSAQLILTAHIPQLSEIWDFTNLLARRQCEKISVGGEVNLEGEIQWKKECLAHSMLIATLKEGSLLQEGFIIEGVDSQFVFDTLQPLTTKGIQRIRATKISVGSINLKNGLLEYLLDKRGFLQIQNFSAEALSGQLKAYRFERINNIGHTAFQFEANFEDIELADILTLTGLSSLSGHGKLAGNASLAYDAKEGIDVLQAELHSISESGLIQYKPPKERKESSLRQTEVNMAFQVLNDLHFTLFNVHITHAPNHTSEMQGIVKILGSNPTILNGYPFEFNIVTTGQLKDLVANTLQHIKPSVELKELKKVAKATNIAKARKKLLNRQDKRQTRTVKGV